jgi:tRNA-intron endonuclease, archaea type
MYNTTSGSNYNNTDNGNELSFTVDARIDNKNTIIIDSIKQQDQLRNKGFGEKIKEKFIIETYEALFLLYNKRLVLKKKRKN